MTKIAYETESCGRCGGSGNYSYNRIDGTRCFGCGGSGERLTKRGKAAKAYADTLLDATVADVQPGDFIYTDICVGFGATKRRRGTVMAVEDAGPTRYKSIRDTEWREARNITVTWSAESFPNEPSVTFSADWKVRRRPTVEQAETIVAYQASLTKAGTPRKKRATTKEADK